MNQYFTQERMTEKPHGTRARYSGGRCRCAACRRANSLYEGERERARRRGDWNGIVDSTPAREHIRDLARKKVGTRIIAEVTDISRSILMKIASGKRPQIRARTLRKILAVSIEQGGDARLVSARQALKHIASMLDEGYTKTWIAKELGYKTRALQIKGPVITQRNAARVAALYRRVNT